MQWHKRVHKFFNRWRLALSGRNCSDGRLIFKRRQDVSGRCYFIGGTDINRWFAFDRGTDIHGRLGVDWRQDVNRRLYFIGGTDINRRFAFDRRTDVHGRLGFDWRQDVNRGYVCDRWTNVDRRLIFSRRQSVQRWHAFNRGTSNGRGRSNGRQQYGNWGVNFGPAGHSDCLGFEPNGRSFHILRAKLLELGAGLGGSRGRGSDTDCSA